MPTSPFNATHASVDPRGLLIRDFLGGAGENQGRMVVATALDLLPPAAWLSEGVQDQVASMLQAECARGVDVFRAADCSRRQVAAFVAGFRRAAAIALYDAARLAEQQHHGNA